MASICNDEQGCFGVTSGHGRKTLRLSEQSLLIAFQGRHRVGPGQRHPGRKPDLHGAPWRRAKQLQRTAAGGSLQYATFGRHIVLSPYARPEHVPALAAQGQIRLALARPAHIGQQVGAPHFDLVGTGSA